MNSLRLLSLTCFILGVITIVYGISTGEVEIGVFFIIPFLIGSGFYAFIGFLLLFASFFLFFIGGLKEIEEIPPVIEDIPLEEPEVYEKPKKKRFFEGGGVVLIGPIPIIFGTNWRITVITIIIAIIFIIIMISFLYMF